MAGDDFTLDGFWSRRFSNVTPIRNDDSGAWRSARELSTQFVEPGLKHVSGDPQASRFIIIQAPGAVGKSAYAEALAARFGLALLDLAAEGNVGANSFVGGAYRFLGPDGPAQIGSGKVGVVVDALDEAQLKVPPESFETFLNDLAETAKASAVTPIVLLGRTASADDAYLTLWERGIEPTLLAIEMFDEEKARQFVYRYFEFTPEPHVARRRPDFRSVALSIVDRLRDIGQEARKDEDAFAGYAPVLNAICGQVAAEPNPTNLVRASDAGAPVGILREVCDAVLRREQKKLLENLEKAHNVDLGSQDPRHETNDDIGLYSAREQRERLWSRIYGRPFTPRYTGLTRELDAAYDEAVTSFFPAHPFLAGTRRGAAANVVFGADLAVRLLLDAEAPTENIVRNYENGRNPFLFDFYAELREPRDPIPMEHVGVLHASLRARSREGQRVLLTAVQSAQGDSKHSIDVRLISTEDDQPAKALSGEATGTNLILVDSPSSGITVESDRLSVWIGSDGPAILEAPCYIQCHSLVLQGGMLSVVGARALPTALDGSGTSDRQVVLIAEEADIDGRLSQRRPTVSPSAELLVAWPNASVFPWNEYQAELVADDVGELEGLRRRLRHLLMTFRSHSRGRLMRYAAKIENARTTKGKLGVILRDALLEDRILSHQGSFYELHPDVLAEKLGIDYVSLRRGETSPRSEDYLAAIQRAIH